MVDAIREDRDSVLTGEDVPTEGSRNSGAGPHRGRSRRAGDHRPGSERARAPDETRRPYIVRRVSTVVELFRLMATMAMMMMTKSTAPTIMASVGSIPRNLLRSVSTMRSDLVSER